jgi:hypothetical protein
MTAPKLPRNSLLKLPHESTFSRAFAEFAHSLLGTVAHDAFIRMTQS